MDEIDVPVRRQTKAKYTATLLRIGVHTSAFSGLVTDRVRLWVEANFKRKSWVISSTHPEAVQNLRNITYLFRRVAFEFGVPSIHVSANHFLKFFNDFSATRADHSGRMKLPLALFLSGVVLSLHLFSTVFNPACHMLHFSIGIKVPSRGVPPCTPRNSPTPYRAWEGRQFLLHGYLLPRLPGCPCLRDCAANTPGGVTRVRAETSRFSATFPSVEPTECGGAWRSEFCSLRCAPACSVPGAECLAIENKHGSVLTPPAPLLPPFDTPSRLSS